MHCDCKDWKIGMDQINSMITMASNRGMNYTAKTFKYCPYCGKELKEECGC